MDRDEQKWLENVERRSTQRAENFDRAWRLIDELKDRVKRESCKLARVRSVVVNLGSIRRRWFAIRGPVRWFAERMEQKLRVHDDRDGWEHCDLDWLTGRVDDELSELRAAVHAYEVARMSGQLSEAGLLARSVADEAADAANFLMMIADNAAAGR